MLGNITREVTSHISDSQQENSHTDVFINVTSMLPCPDTGLFYSSCGKIKENVIHEMLTDSTPKVVGWYRYRRNNSLKMTMRDKILSRGLKKYFERHNCRYFLCCNITCRQTPGNSTHTFSYRFSKICHNGSFEMMQDVTSNLGEKVSGYKRGMKGDRCDPFNKAVRTASGKGIASVASAIERALSEAATEAVQHETAIRAVSTEINQMIQLLADHYQTNVTVLQPTRCDAARLKSERELVQPILASVTAPIPEPFDFVNDLIKNDLKRYPPVQNAQSSTSAVTESCPALRVATSSGLDTMNEIKVSGHKRIHSEGALSSENMVCFFYFCKILATINSTLICFI